MNRNIIILVVAVLVAFGAGIGAGVFGLLWATGGNATPSRDTQEVAETLDLDAPTPTPGDLVRLSRQLDTLIERVDQLSTQVGELAEAGVVVGATEAPAAEATTEATAEATEAAAVPDPARALYRISEEGSEARFILDEEILGNPNTVVGTTNRVAGDIIIDFANPASSQLGTIAVNARTLRTDDDFRDQSIRGQILESSQDEFEFITFDPTELVGLPTEPVGVGDEVSFDIVGDLTIRTVTQEVTFAATVTITSEEQISGLASTTVTRTQYELVVETPPNIGNVEEQVTIELEFVANLVEAR